jgi:hypothetical protein
MVRCPICANDAQRSMIDAELAAGLKPSVIAARYRVRKMLVEHHAEHLLSEPPGAQGSLRHGNRQISSGVVIPVRAHARLPETSEDCACEWCAMNTYQRLRRAWQDATLQEKERFCADTRTMDVPF